MAFSYPSNVAALVEFSDEMRVAISRLCRLSDSAGRMRPTASLRRRAAQSYMEEITQQLLKIEALTRELMESPADAHGRAVVPK